MSSSNSTVVNCSSETSFSSSYFINKIPFFILFSLRTCFILYLSVLNSICRLKSPNSLVFKILSLSGALSPLSGFFFPLT